MAASSQSMRPLAICSRCLKSQKSISLPIRTFSASATSQATAAAATQATKASPSLARMPPLTPTDQLDPNTVSTVSEEHRLMKHRKLQPIGSRRRRAALASLSKNEQAIPFEQLPYQCFQEARNVLAEDRREKVAQIEKMRKRIAYVEGADVSKVGGEASRAFRLTSMRRELENLKILADVNDPVIKKRFEDGLGDMNKPIYRYYAHKKWASMKRKILLQRITQMHVIPDVLPSLTPTLDIDLLYHRRAITPGDFVPSNWSEQPPSLRIQKFDKGSALLTIVAMDSDVPDEGMDGFGSRCHGLWTNIEITPTKTDVGRLGANGEQTILPWIPPHAQKGSPYHRISLLVFQQPDNNPLTAEQIAEAAQQQGPDTNLWVRGFTERAGLKAVGATMFRTVWDEHTKAVMERNGLEGADVEFRRRKPERLPEKDRVRDGLRYRGWRK